MSRKDLVFLQLFKNAFFAYKDNEDEYTTAKVEDVHYSEENLRGWIAHAGIIMIGMNQMVKTLKYPAETKNTSHACVKDLNCK